MYINKATIYGNLVRDPELKVLPSGNKVATFSIATSRVFKSPSGERKEEAEFHNIVAYGKAAETISQYMRKGKSIHVEGRMTTRTWDKDGIKQYRTEIILNEFQFGPSLKMVGQEVDMSQNDPVNPEDIPF